MKKGTLILEGGAVRGVFTSGVLDYLMEKDLYFSHVVGVSAGTCNGVNYVSRQIEENEKVHDTSGRRVRLLHGNTEVY